MENKIRHLKATISELEHIKYYLDNNDVDTSDLRRALRSLDSFTDYLVAHVESQEAEHRKRLEDSDEIKDN